jgi:hypothetical protein
LIHANKKGYTFPAQNEKRPVKGDYIKFIEVTQNKGIFINKKVALDKTSEKKDSSKEGKIADLNNSFESPFGAS